MMMSRLHRRIGLGIVPVAILIGGYLLVGSSIFDDSARADPDNAQQVALGQAVYSANCASCHGVNLAGDQDWRTRKSDGRLPPPPHDKTGHTWHHPDEDLFGITKNGLSNYAPPNYETDMPAFAEVLTDEEIWAVLSFIKSTWPERQLTYQKARSNPQNDSGSQQ